MAGSSRGAFSGRIGFIAAAAGSAVGLGNIWKFPFEVRDGGGAAFLIIYLLCAFLICLPIMVAEISLGRRTGLNPQGAYKQIGGRSWGLVGLFGVICGIMILSFYNVVAGWSFGYFIETVFGDLLSQPDHGAFFTEYIASPGRILLYAGGFMALTMLVVMGGVKRGIERWTKILMPMLLVILLGMIVYGATLKGAAAGYRFYLEPDFSKLSAEVVFGALSQAFFSLSLGMGALITYGSYVSKRDNVVSNAALVTITDVSIAFLAGLMVFPLMFSTGAQDADAGPGLVFVVLPGVFQGMGSAGTLVGGVFFMLLCFAALTSTISLLEVPVSYMTDRFKSMSRRTAVLFMGLLIFALGVPSLLGNGYHAGLSELASYGGKTKSFMDVIIDFFSDFGLAVGGMLLSLFVAYRWGIQGLYGELEQGNPAFVQSWYAPVIKLMITIICPLFILGVVIVTVLKTFFNINVFG